MQTQIEQFLASKAFAVVGTSTNREKFGNKVLRAYLTQHKKVYPIHPIEKEIEGLACLKSVNDLPDEVKSISIITPSSLTEKIVEEAHVKGITSIWMQPGAESQLAIQKCHEHGINLIAGGPCILVEFGFSSH